MEFVLLGDNQGKTMRVAGFIFRDGVCEVADDVQAVTTANNILSRFHNAHPAHMVEEGPDGKLQLRQAAPEEMEAPAADMNPHPFVPAAVEKLDEVDEAGGAAEDTGNGKKPGKRAK